MQHQLQATADRGWCSAISFVSDRACRAPLLDFWIKLVYCSTRVPASPPFFVKLALNTDFEQQKSAAAAASLGRLSCVDLRTAVKQHASNIVAELALTNSPVLE